MFLLEIAEKYDIIKVIKLGGFIKVMKLNKSAKKELRASIEEQLKQVPDGQRVHLDKELLEDLIFFKGKSKNGTIIKVPIWTGHFLRKIDLSEVSFDNVCFIYDGGTIFGGSFEDIMSDKFASQFEKSNYYRDSKVAPFVRQDNRLHNMIDFSGTNIDIDFSKIYCDAIEHTDFSGVDLSKSNFQCLTRIIDCNFSGTKISIDFNSDRDIMFNSTDFSFNDFSQSSIDSFMIFYDGVHDCKFHYCIFSNTGLKIRHIYDNSENDKRFGYVLKSGLLENCFVNDKKILSKAEKQALASEKLREYEAYKEELFSSVESSIKIGIPEQIGRKKK